MIRFILCASMTLFAGCYLDDHFKGAGTNRDFSVADDMTTDGGAPIVGDMATGEGGDDLQSTAECTAPTPNQCGTLCTDLQSDSQNCHDCGTHCAYANAASVCSQGMCVMGACFPGYMHCSSDPSSGCETYVKGNDSSNCGSCGAVCKVGQICSAGNCVENQVTCMTPGITCTQAACYEAGRYSVSASGGIAIDTMSNRLLITRATRGPLSHIDALNNCAALVLEGINGWRLPTATENSSTLYMASTVQGCNVCNPAVDQAVFNDTLPVAGAVDTFYQSNTYGSSPAGWDEIDYCFGGAGNRLVDGTAVFRCVHDPLP